MTKLAEYLRQLEVLDLIKLKQSEPDLIYSFKHVFTQESVYNSLLLSDRRQLHGQVGEALEKLYATSANQRGPDSSDSNESALLLAYHFQQGQNPAKAIKYLKQAATHAKRTYANQEARALYGQILALLDETNLVEQWNILAEREQILSRLGDRHHQAEDLAAMKQLAQITNDLPRLAMTCSRQATYYDKTSQYEQAAEVAQQGLEIARKTKNERLEAQSLNQLALAAWRQFDYQTVKRYANQALDALRVMSDPTIRIGSLLHLGKASYRLGEYDAALEYIHAVKDLAKTTGNFDSEVNANLILGWIYQRLGDYHSAANNFQSKLRKDRMTGDRYGEATAVSHLGWVACDQQDYEKGLDYCQQALEISQAIDDRENEAYSLTGLGLNYKQLGQLDLARDYYHQALAIHREIGATTLEIFDLAELGTLALANNDLPTARTYIGPVSAWILEGKAQQFWDPWSIYLAAYQLLEALNETDTAMKILTEAHTILHQRAEAISDESLRNRFLTHVQVNKDIEAAWQAKTS